MRFRDPTRPAARRWLFGTITADGGFVVSASQPVFDSQFYVTAKFTRVDDARIDATLVTETRFSGRLAYTFRYSVGTTRQ